MTDRPEKNFSPFDDMKHASNRRSSGASEVGDWFRALVSDCQYLAAFAGSRKNEGKAENDAT